MESVLFVFQVEESRRKYQLFIDAVEDYGYFVKVITKDYYFDNISDFEDGYSAVFTDYLSDDTRFKSLSGLDVCDLINDINVILCN